MKGLFSDLHKLGIAVEDESTKVFEPEQPKKETVPVVKQTIQQKDVLFDRETECPLCEYKTTNRFVMTGKIRLLNTEYDLRPVYTIVDPIMYDVVICPNCGYAALSRFFKNLSAEQKAAIIEKITPNFKPRKYPDVFNYPIAIERYKLALYCAIVKKTVASEKCYIMMKLLWLLRAYKEQLIGANMKPEVVAQIGQDQIELMRNTIEGFKRAIDNETFPINGLDKMTVIYLIAVYYYDLEEFKEALFWLSKIVTGTNVNSRLKSKSLELKNKINEKSEVMTDE